MQLHNPLNPSTGLEDPAQLPWTTGVPSTGTEGSYFGWQQIVEPMDELVNLITLAGLTPASSDLNQVTRAVRGGQLDFDATDTGTADAVLCQVGLAHTAIAAGLPFTFIKGPAANTGNAVPTLTITDASGNNGLTGQIVKSGGGVIAKGDLPANALITVRARAPGVFAVVSMVLVSDVLAIIAANQIGITNVVTFKTPGTFTYTPSAGTRAIEVELVGGGGGGGTAVPTTSTQVAAGISGDGGTWGKKYIVGPAASYSITIGAGGFAGTSSNSGTGGTGGTTSFGSVASVPGGTGGPAGFTQSSTQAGNSTTAVGGGASTGCDVDLQGETSTENIFFGNGALVVGHAGSSEYGRSGIGYGVTSNGAPGLGYGSGGTGAACLASSATQQSGGAGAGGLIIVREIK